MNQLDMAFLRQMQNPIVFVLATYDDGAIPMNATNFVREVRSSRDSLSGLVFAVLALGTGGGLFEALESKGARPLLPLTTATGQKDFVAFIEALATAQGDHREMAAGKLGPQVRGCQSEVDGSALESDGCRAWDRRAPSAMLLP
jgi:sulfite reductase alpha subunit-like flavoprotein